MPRRAGVFVLLTRQAGRYPMTIDLDSSGPTSRIYFSQRLRLHYVDWGNPAAPPLLLIHGGRDHCRNWDWVATALRRDWHVLAPDLRGHGDSQWSPDGNYSTAAYVYDLAQLIHQQELAPVTIVAHSLGGHIAIRYAGVFPDNLRRLVAIEGLGPSPRQMAARSAIPIAERMQRWVVEQRALAGRLPRRYATIEDALRRMQEANAHLSPEQARHLTQHGVNQNEDGTYSWKFDNYVRTDSAYGMTQNEIEQLWERIACPTLLVYGKESWAANPEQDGRLRHFQDARIVSVEGAGHWVHHDRLDAFLALLRSFL
jgi:pimeloyl-ACP methyl ester carboxylesterase